MTSEITPRQECEITTKREEMKEELHNRTSQLSNAIEVYLKEQLHKAAQETVGPIIERVLLILDNVPIDPPEEREKSPQDELDEILERGAHLVAEKTSRSVKKSLDSTGGASINSATSIWGWFKQSK